MILSNQSLISAYTKEGVWGDTTLDALFRKNVRNHHDQIALVDPPNREEFTCGPARRLTYGEADEIIEDLVVMFAHLKLKRDDVVAVQLPNTIELPLLILACFRAGIIISILPPLWGEHELENALNRISPKLLITQKVEGEIDYPGLIRQAAGKVYSVCHVLAWGDEVPDGIVPVDKAMAFAKDNLDGEPAENNSSAEITANDVAVITWNGVESPDHMPMARSHNQLIATALSVLLEAPLEQKSVILCPFSLSGLGALGSFFVPWILTGGGFLTHQPFDWLCFKQQIEHEQPTFAGLPAAAMTRLCEDVNGGELDLSCLKTLACVWPVPVLSHSGSNCDTYLLPAIVDIFNLGELAIFAQARTPDQPIGHLPHGPCKFPSSTENGPTLLTTRLEQLPLGQLMIKSPMIYDREIHARSPEGEGFTPLERDAQGFVATGITCEAVGPDKAMLKPVERCSSIIYHGGLAVAAGELDAIYSQFPGIERAVAVSIPDALLGQRIAAAIVPSTSINFSYNDFKMFLRDRKLAAYKIPGRVITVADIPVDEDGNVVRKTPDFST